MLVEHARELCEETVERIIARKMRPHTLSSVIPTFFFDQAICLFTVVQAGKEVCYIHSVTDCLRILSHNKLNHPPLHYRMQ